ncbi:MAG: Rieske 2Fe-2S domain-containing protein [Halioglobus sp.]
MSHIANFADLADNSTTALVIDQRPLLLMRKADELYIYENRCPHVADTLDPEGGSVASPDGLLIHCQRHGAEFLSHTGECVAGPCQGERLTPIAHTVANGDIYLD